MIRRNTRTMNKRDFINTLDYVSLHIFIVLKINSSVYLYFYLYSVYCYCFSIVNFKYINNPPESICTFVGVQKSVCNIYLWNVAFKNIHHFLMWPMNLHLLLFVSIPAHTLETCFFSFIYHFDFDLFLNFEYYVCFKVKHWVKFQETVKPLIISGRKISPL